MYGLKRKAPDEDEDDLQNIKLSDCQGCSDIDDVLLWHTMPNPGRAPLDPNIKYCGYCDAQATGEPDWKKHLIGRRHIETIKTKEIWFMPTVIMYEKELQQLRAARTVLLGPATLEDLADAQIAEQVHNSTCFRLHYEKHNVGYFGYIELSFPSEESARHCAETLPHVIRESMIVRHIVPKSNTHKRTKILHVKNLSRETTEQTLQAAFPTASRVRVVVDQRTNRPRGFAFVDFENTDDSAAALEHMEGQEIDGHSITIAFSTKDNTPYSNKPGDMNGGCFNCGEKGHVLRDCSKGTPELKVEDHFDVTGGISIIPIPVTNTSKILCVLSLEPSLTYYDLRSAFPTAVNINIPWSYTNDIKKCHAYVEFTSEEEVQPGKVQIRGDIYKTSRLQTVPSVDQLAAVLDIERSLKGAMSSGKFKSIVKLYRQVRHYLDTDFPISNKDQVMLQTGRRFLLDRINNELRTVQREQDGFVEPFYRHCEVCEVSMNSPHTWQLHVEGKKHLSRIGDGSKSQKRTSDSSPGSAQTAFGRQDQYGHDQLGSADRGRGGPSQFGRGRGPIPLRGGRGGPTPFRGGRGEATPFRGGRGEPTPFGRGRGGSTPFMRGRGPAPSDPFSQDPFSSKIEAPMRLHDPYNDLDQQRTDDAIERAVERVLQNKMMKGELGGGSGRPMAPQGGFRGADRQRMNNDFY